MELSHSSCYFIFLRSMHFSSFRFKYHSVFYLCVRDQDSYRYIVQEFYGDTELYSDNLCTRVVEFASVNQVIVRWINSIPSVRSSSRPCPLSCSCL